MAESLTAGKRPAKSPSQAVAPPEARVFSPDEFEADTQEDRPIAVLAEKRRQFLARLGAHTGDAPAAE